jgi:hypothetical protein
MKQEGFEVLQKTWSEILLILGGITTTIMAWRYGRKQQNKRDDMTSITDGAQSVINMSRTMLEQIKADWDEDKQGRHDCEERMRKIEEEMHVMKIENKILSEKLDRITKR